MSGPLTRCLDHWHDVWTIDKMSGPIACQRCYHTRLSYVRVKCYAGFSQTQWRRRDFQSISMSEENCCALWV